MQLGQVIRKYRKNKNMTQEEMAGRLGVTAPAVNKWENGASAGYHAVGAHCQAFRHYDGYFTVIP